MNSGASGIPSTSLEFTKMKNLNSTANIAYSTQLANLPESVIHRVFSYLSHPELLQAQRVNKQFYRLIRRNVHLLCRPKVMEMGISMCGCEKRARPFGRLQTSLMLKANRRRRLFVRFTRKASSVVKYRELFKDEDYTGDRNDLSENLLNYLDQQFKETNIHGVLSFSGIAITTNLYNSLCKSWVRIDSKWMLLVHRGLELEMMLLVYRGCEIDQKWICQIAKLDHADFDSSNSSFFGWQRYGSTTCSCTDVLMNSNATRLVFTLCRFRLSSKYFCKLLMRTNCQQLNIELSHFEQCLIDDLVLEAMPECRELILSSATPIYFACFTDSSLHRWAVQEKLPKKILLRNIRANFTFDGVITLINALQIRHPELFSDIFQPTISVACCRKTVYDWDFGCIVLPEQNQGNGIVELLSTPGVVTHVSRSCNLANAIDITINSKDFYLSTTKCQVSIRFQLIISSQKDL